MGTEIVTEDTLYKSKMGAAGFPTILRRHRAAKGHMRGFPPFS